MPTIVIDKQQNFAQVNFSNRGLVTVFPTVRSLDPQTPNRDTVVEVAKILEEVVVEKTEPTGFASIPEFVGLDYIGYIVDKERLDKATGQWVRIDEYRVVGSMANNFKDSRLAYGNCYRYRIKSIIKITKREEVESLEKFDLQEDIRELEARLIGDNLAAQQEVIASIDAITNLGISSQTSRGDVPTTFNLLEGLTVEATAKGTKTVAVAADTAINNIQNLRQMQNLNVQDFNLITGTISSTELQRIVEKTVSKFTESKFTYTSFYYTSNPTGWKYVNVAEFKPPPPPSAIKITPSSPNGWISVTWLTPAHIQRDIVAFKLYRRNMTGQAWEKLGEFSLIDNFFVDKSVKFNREYTYALTSLDAHGLESVLSTQIQAELNPNFSVEQEERALRWISGSGARPDKGFTQVFKKFFEPEVPIVAENNIVIGPTTVFKEESKRFLVRVTSLDVHETKEFVLQIQNENVGSP